MIQVPTAEPVTDEPIIAIDTADIIIVEPEPELVVVPPLPQSPRRNECKCVLCGVCSLCILTILCFGIPI